MRTVVYLVRHAQASFGADDYDALSPEGHQQAAVLGHALRGRLARIDAAVTGRMRRHRETAHGCLDAMGLKLPLEEDAGWDEYDHEAILRAHEPRYADRAALAEDILAHDDPPRAFQRIFAAAVDRWTSGAHDHEYAETWPAFRARVEAALARLHRDEGPRTAVVFTSGGPILAACQATLGLDTPRALRLGWALANASVTKLALTEQGPRLVTFNEQGHFAGEHAGLLTFR